MNGFGLEPVGNIPSSLTTFVGRDEEIERIKTALREHRLVSLIGFGGIGKTRAALESAHLTRRSYPGGCWFIDLGVATQLRSITDYVAAEMRLVNEVSAWTVSDLAARIAHTDTLLILDNSEHVIDQVVAFVDELLGLAPKARILVTSRQALGMPGEVLIHLRGLTYPNPQHDESLSTLENFDSVQLFIARARSILPEFTLTDENAAAVAAIVRRLDGMPLAIELAAGRLRALSPQQIEQRLGGQFELLGARRGTNERHHTLRATIGWSFDLCNEQEQLAWSRLSVFPAEFDLEAAEAIATGDSIAHDDVLDLISSLIDKSILDTVHEAGINIRYRLSYPVRNYGREKLSELEPDNDVRDRYLKHYRMRSTVIDELFFGPTQIEQIEVIRRERANFERALEFAVAKGDAAAVNQLAQVNALVAFIMGSLSEAAGALRVATELPDDRPGARVQLLWLASWVLTSLGELSRAHELAAESLRQAEAVSDTTGRGHALQHLAQCQLLENNISAAEESCQSALDIARQEADEHLLATVLIRWSQVRTARSDFVEAQAALEESIAISERHNEYWCRSFAMWHLAVLRHLMGDPLGAMEEARKAVLANVKFEDKLNSARGLEVMAWSAYDQDQQQHAAVLFGSAETLWEMTGATMTHQLKARRKEYSDKLAAQLGTDVCSSLYAEGRHMAPQIAVQWSDAAHVSSPRNVVQVQAGVNSGELTQTVDTLTRRELQVAKLVASGMKNVEIAEYLVISPRTVEVHVQRILKKLNFTSRVQISSWLSRQ